MYRKLSGSTHNLSDAEDFLTALNAAAHPFADAPAEDGTGAEIVVARAPGRLDVMGGIADYSGSLVLQLPIREATLVALQRDPSRRLTILSRSEDSAAGPLTFEMSLEDFGSAQKPQSYEAARARFQADPARHWAAYVAGVFLVLMRERNFEFREGARILISSSVPQGKGVSSSAALEVSVMQAVAGAFEIPLEAREIALLCQIVENRVAGAPCGVMDQMTAACGESDRLLALLCQPAELLGSIPVPGEIAFWGLDSGVRHAVTGADYGSVRVGTFMGYRMIAVIAGFDFRQSPAEGSVEVDDPVWGGYLANLTPSEFDEVYAPHLPERIRGVEFLDRYEGSTDRVTRIAPDQTYSVRIPAAHAVHEHHRVRLFAELLQSEVGERRLQLLGELMYQSHASYSACGLGSPGTNRLVELVRSMGNGRGLYGAKITGGGSGGTVALLGRRDADGAVREIAGLYAAETGLRPHIFSGSSPGAAAFGALRLAREKTPAVRKSNLQRGSHDP